MKTRVITAVVALALFVPIVYIGGDWLLGLALILGAVAMSEFLRMKKRLLVSPEALISTAAALALILPKGFWANIPMIHGAYLFFYLMGFLLLGHTVFSRHNFNFDDAGSLLLAALYVGTGFHYFVAARETGLATLMFGLLIVWITDSGAYLVGRQIGKNKLAPKISPNKTWEGSIGGSLAAVILVVVIYTLGGWLTYNWLELAGFALVLSVAGQLGDLVESAFKRHYGVKDSGTILPGHGGILDRFDSMLIVLPLMGILGML